MCSTYLCSTSRSLWVVHFRSCLPTGRDTARGARWRACSVKRAPWTPGRLQDWSPAPKSSPSSTLSADNSQRFSSRWVGHLNLAPLWFGNIATLGLLMGYGCLKEKLVLEYYIQNFDNPRSLIDSFDKGPKGFLNWVFFLGPEFTHFHWLAQFWLRAKLSFWPSEW